MIGIVIFGHGRLAHELARAGEMILGAQEALVAVGVEPDEGEAAITGRLNEAIEKADDGGDGILLLTDMFGGTPMNFGCLYLDASGIEVVTGINLAMLIKALTGRKAETTLPALAEEVARHGRKDISVAGAILRGASSPSDEVP